MVTSFIVHVHRLLLARPLNVGRQWNVTDALQPAVITTVGDIVTSAMGVVPEYIGAWKDAPVRSSEYGPTPEPPVKARSMASA